MSSQRRRATGTSYVEWGAVFAGALAASAISFVLLTAGASIGLSLISPYRRKSYAQDRRVDRGVLVGRRADPVVPRRRLHRRPHALGLGGREHDEVQFRDGMHGMLVWALSIVAGGVLAFLAAGAVANSGAQVAAGALSNREAVVAPAIDTCLASRQRRRRLRRQRQRRHRVRPRGKLPGNGRARRGARQRSPRQHRPYAGRRGRPPGSSRRRRSARWRRSFRNVPASRRPKRSSASIRPTRMR